MSTTDSGSANPGLGLWPKIVLWSLVLVFGVLYLGSVKRNPPADSPGSVTLSPQGPASGVVPSPVLAPAPEAATAPQVAPAPKLAPAPGLAAVPEVGPSPGGDGSGPFGQVAQGGDQTPDAASVPAERAQAPAPAVAPEPVRAAESAAFVDSLLNKESADGSPGDSGGPAEPAAGSSAEGVTDQSQASREAAAAGAVTSAGEGGSGSDAPPPAAPVGAGGPGQEARPAREGARPGAEIGARSAETQEVQRARILREYEAMRRAAEEQMRQYWQQMGAPGPGAMPYSPSGYGPGGHPPRH